MTQRRFIQIVFLSFSLLLSLSFFVGCGGKGVTPVPEVRPLVILTKSLPNFTPSQFYQTTIQAAGGVPPYHWSVLSGSLPAGLVLDASTGTISGTPEDATSASFVILVVDSDYLPQVAKMER